MKLKSMAIAALALSSLFAAAAEAKPVTLTAPTKDGKTATVAMDVEGSVGTISMENIARAAFRKTARDMNCADLQTEAAANAFINTMINIKQVSVSKGMTPSSDLGFRLTQSPTCAP